MNDVVKKGLAEIRMVSFERRYGLSANDAGADLCHPNKQEDRGVPFFDSLHLEPLGTLRAFKFGLPTFVAALQLRYAVLDLPPGIRHVEKSIFEAGDEFFYCILRC
jgi:hypothetical protein